MKYRLQVKITKKAAHSLAEPVSRRRHVAHCSFIKTRGLIVGIFSSANNRVIGLMLLPVISLPVSGQDADDLSETEANSGANRVIEEVLVSATKRDTDLQDTGMAISVLRDDELALRDMRDLQDMQNSIPGLHVGAILGSPIINIRGIGLNLLTGMGTPGVATHYDAIYIPRVGATTTATVDLDRVEVLRGPQGTLYGRNATGGSVNFVGKRPAEEFGFGVTAGAGDYDRRFYEGYIEGPLLLDGLAARVFLRKDQFGGYGENEASGKAVGTNDAEMSRLSVSYDVTESLAIYLSYSQREDKGNYPYQSALSGMVTIAGDPVPEDTMTFKPRNTKVFLEPITHSQTEISNLTITWNFGGYTLKSISGYIQHDRYEMYSAQDSTHFISLLERPEYSDAWSQEINLSGSWFDKRLNWLLGLYFAEDDGASPLRAKINNDGLLVLPLPKTGSYIYMDPISETVDTSEAIFIDGYWSIFDALRLIFGARFSRDKQVFTQTFMPDLRDSSGNEIPGSSLIVGQIPLFSETCEDLTSTYKTDSTDPKIGLEWGAAEDVLLYAQYQTGYKSGGFDIVATCTASFEPEEIESYEMGIKTTLLDDALTLNVAVFDYTYTNFQVQQVEGFGSKIDNAPEAVSRGAEIELAYIPVEWLSLDAQYSYLDTEYTEFFSRDGYKNSSAFQKDAPLEDLSGNKLSRAPEHSINLGVTTFIPINKFGLGMAQLRMEGYYSAELYFREFNTDEELQDSYLLFNSFLSVASVDERYAVNLFVKNITDEDYLVGQLPLDIIKYRGGYYAPPRTYGASISMKW